MANRRMFSLNVVDTDRFLEMPVSAQALYFHLGMHGDDDGFVASPQKITRSVGCNADDLRLLAAKNFIIPFDSGVVVITDWKRNNTLKNDRYSETDFREEKALLIEDKTGKYMLGSSMVPDCFHNGTSVEPQHNITEPNLTENNIGDRAVKPPTRHRFSPPGVEDVKAYCKEQGYTSVDPERFVNFYESKGWMVGRSKMKSWQAAVRNWAKRESEEKGNGKRTEDYAEFVQGIGLRL